MKVLRMNANGTCSVCQAKSLGGDVPVGSNFTADSGSGISLGGHAPITISAPVGNRKSERVIRGGNRPEDVRAIQMALNKFPPADGGPSPKLTVDGVVGPRTEYAVEFFQRKWGYYPTGWNAPDVVVDVEGRTINRLRVGPPQTKQSGKELAFAALPRLLAMLPVAQVTVRAARANVNTPGPPFLKQMDVVGQAALATLNRVFKTEGSPTLRHDLVFIETMLQRMLMAAVQAQATGGIFQDEPSYVTSPAVAFTTMGGFFKPELAEAQIDSAQSIVMQSGYIYFCPGFKVLTPEGQLFTLIHEMAHYAGPLDPSGITDFAYQDQPGYAKLPRAQALLNAESYADFVFVCNGILEHKDV